MTEDELHQRFKALEDRVDSLKAGLDKARGWWQPRWHAMQADPQAAMLCFAVGFVIAQLWPLHPLSWIGL